jgi:hypothetical protein
MTTTSSHHRVAAPLLPPVVSYAVLTVAAVALPPLVSGVSAWTSGHDQLVFFQQHTGAAHLSAFLTFGAAVPFAVLTAVATTRLRTLGVDVPGRIIAQIGGAVAAAMLALAGLSTLALTRSHVADSGAVVRALSAFTFAVGGPGFVVFAGLLVAGISIAGLLSGVLPRWLGRSGIVLAAVCELASLSVGFDALDVLLPIGRFGGLAWLLALGFLLPATRRELRARRGEVRAADVS